MNTFTFWRTAVVLGFASLLTGCIGVDFTPNDRFREAFHYSFDLQPGGRIALDNFNGAIEIRGWDQNKVEVDGEKSAATESGLRDLRIDVRNTPDLVELRTVRPSNSGWFPNAGARYTVRVPRAAKLDRIVTTNGRIEVSDLDGTVRLKTSNGRIRGERLRGGVDAQTTNGQVELTAIEGSSFVRTSNGAVTIEMTRPPVEGIRAETRNGSITLRLPEDTGARLEANTSNSRIQSDFEIRGHARMERTYTSGEIGQGGPLIELRTSNGAIRILRN